MAREMTKTIRGSPELAPENLGQGKRLESQFRLQVDRQTKASFTTFDAAAEIGLTVRKKYPIVQVAVYDAVLGVNKIIDLRKD